MTEHFVCVYRTGGPYDVSYVNKLFSGLSRHVSGGIELTCLTNDGRGLHPSIRAIPLEHDWPRWWSKIELFRRGVLPTGRVWYFDLDTIIVRNLDSILNDNRHGRRFYGLEDAMVPNRFASGVMSWMTDDPEAASIYTDFVHRDDRVIRSCSTLGDQCWMGMNVSSPTFLQREFPNAFLSLKVNCGHRPPPPTAQVVFFHGTPRPHEAINDPRYQWVRKHWT